ncbi:hypothetical protein MED121_22317 [Marinomonas sp. MED121]|uniref:type I secretion system permease/ATPase n=1 Tax=Marinomonas sp. MED121 TaxID=314277 RepID=UPI000068FDBB|nr:type I secretion system permease/ATPase [Marinomonas sp. MED121]EAQ65453.1 hypothetical protein MED121_22317 [Marinomonas sp. MED121]
MFDSKKENRIPRSALDSCRLLLQLSGIKELFSPVELSQGGLLKEILKQYGKENHCEFRLKRLKFADIESQTLPIVYQQKKGEFAVLARVADQQALIQSPDSATPDILSFEELKSDWHGNIIVLQNAKQRFDIAWFIPEFVKHRRLIIEVLLFSLMLQILALATPLFFQLVMDKVMVHQALSTLDVLVFILLVVGIFEIILKGLRDYLFAHTSNRIDINLGIKLFRHLLGLPLLYFKHRQVGAIITRVQELDSIRDFLTGSMLTLFVDVLFTFVFFVVMFWLSPTLTYLVLASLPFYFLLARYSTSPLQASIERQFQAEAMNTSFLNETVSGAETIKSLAVEPRMQRRWESQTGEMVIAGFKTQTLNSLVNHGVILLQKVTSVSIIWVGSNLVMELELTIGQLIAFNMMASHVSQPIAKLIELWQQFVRARVAVDKLADMLNIPVEQSLGSIIPDKPLIGQLQLKQLVFSYQPDHPPVIRELDLTVQPGETIGIVGPSGSGKSTLTKLIQKLYIPDSGDIQVDGISLQSLDPNYLRRQVGVVLQESYLFNRSVRHNIAIKDPTVSLDIVISAAKLAGAHDFILQLPRGYDTILAEGGSSLSGGQRQRIAIVRALIANPKILIFDEATSALDDESQAIILENMDDIARGRTVITIAHRLSTVRQCDRIIVMEKGQITESGKHHELLKNEGCYARLWQLQQELRKEPT